MIDIYEVVKKLVGPIVPVGESHIDGKRLENLTRLTYLIEGLLADIDTVASEKDSKLASVKLAAKFATEFNDRIVVKITALNGEG